MGNDSLGGFGPVWFGPISVRYLVAKGLTPTEANSVALAIFLDYQYRFETAQLRALDLISAFAGEDLFSDLLGFYQEYTGKNLQDVINEDLGGVVGEMNEINHALETAHGHINLRPVPWNPYTRQPVPIPESIRRQLDVAPAPEGAMWRFVSETVDPNLRITFRGIQIRLP